MTTSPSLPTTPGAVQAERPEQNAWSSDAFVVKVSPDGVGILGGTYLGGAEDTCTGSVSGLRL